MTLVGEVQSVYSIAPADWAIYTIKGAIKKKTIVIERWKYSYDYNQIS